MRAVPSPRTTAPGGGSSRRAFPHLAGAALLALGYAAFAWGSPIGAGAWAPFGPSAATPDSASYLRLDSDPRTWAGYPAFLGLVVGLFGTPEAALPIQAAVTAASALFLAWAAARALGAPRLAPVAALAVLGPGAVSRFDAYFLSEALFVPLLVFALGFATLAAARPTAARFAAGAACAALAVAVRPGGLALLLAWPALLWVVSGRPAGGHFKKAGGRFEKAGGRFEKARRRAGGAGGRLRLAVAAALPVAAVFVLEGAVWRRAHPGHDHRPRTEDTHLFAKALLVPSEPPPSADSSADDLFRESRRRAAPLRALVAGAPDLQLRSVLLRRAEQAAQDHRVFGLEERVGALAAERGLTSLRFLGGLGRRALFAAPGEWAANAATHYFALFTRHTLHTTSFARALEAGAGKFDADTPAPGARLGAPVSGNRRLPPWAVGVNRAAAAFSFAASLAALGLAGWRRLSRRRPDPVLAAAAIAGFFVHGYFLTAGAFNFATMRYAAAMWPFEVLAAVLLLAFLLRRAPARPEGSPAGSGRRVAAAV